MPVLELQAITKHFGAIHALAFSPNGTRALFSSPS